MRTPLFVTAVFVITFGVLAAVGLILGVSQSLPHGDVTITQLSEAGEAPVQVAQTDFRPRRPF